MKRGVALLAVLLAVAACSANGPAVAHSTPSSSPSASPSPSPTPTPTPAPSPSPTPSPAPTPLAVPAWAQLHASCGGAASAQEAVLSLQGQTSLVIADVSDARNPHTICTLAGNPSSAGQVAPELVTQTMISWYSSQANHNPTPLGTSLIAVLDLTTGSSTVAASWQGGGFLDGLHAWSPDRGFLAYVTSDPNAVNLHLLSGGGDRVVSTMGAVPGRGGNPLQDDAYLAFSPDGAYFALDQTFTGSGDQLQVFRTQDGSVAYSLHTGTMATWGSTGSSLYFRQPGSGVVEVWSSGGGVKQAIGQQLQWIQPRADAGDDNLAFTVRDSTGMPSVWLYGHGGRSGGKLPNPRSGPVWLNSTTLLDFEESKCTGLCQVAWSTDGKTYTFDTATQTETASRIAQVYGVWPRPGQT